jgi:hypothetical protein
MTHVDVLVDRDFILEKASGDYVNRFRVAGAKLTVDGSPQGFTALRDRPYYAPVGPIRRAISAMPRSGRLRSTTPSTGPGEGLHRAAGLSAASAGGDAVPTRGRA